MKLRSVLLGSVAIAGLTTAGYAADLGVVTSLDVCDSLSISGLTISSDQDCLQISGNISFEYDYGDYEAGGNGATIYDGNTGGLARDTNYITILDGGGTPDSSIDIDWWLKFVATADSDFGPATATIKLIDNNWTGQGTTAVQIKEAWVGIGDTTKLMAGYKGSIFNKGDDTPLDYLGLFNSDDVNKGVYFDNTATTGGTVIQVTSDLGNGLSIGGGLENLSSHTFGNPQWTAVGVLSYAGDAGTGHISTAVNENGLWNVHAGFTGTFDKVKVVGAIAANNEVGGGPMWWDALGSASIDLDMFTLAGSVEATSANEWGASASIGATVSDGVKVNLGGRYFTNTATGAYVGQVEAGVSAAVTEAITLSGSVGAYMGNATVALPHAYVVDSDYYGKAQISWNPGGGFASSASIEAHSTGGYKAVFKASKSIK